MHICQIKRISAEIFFLKWANEYFFVNGPSNQRVDYNYGNQNVTKNSPVVCDGYVKYEEAEVDRSAIMQDFRDNKEKKINLDFVSVIFVMGYPCGDLTFCFLFMVQLFSFFFG